MTPAAVIRPWPSATPSILEGESVTLLCTGSLTPEVIYSPSEIKVINSPSKIRGGQGALNYSRNLNNNTSHFTHLMAGEINRLFIKINRPFRKINRLFTNLFNMPVWPCYL